MVRYACKFVLEYGKSRALAHKEARYAHQEKHALNVCACIGVPPLQQRGPFFITAKQHSEGTVSLVLCCFWPCWNQLTPGSWEKLVGARHTLFRARARSDFVVFAVRERVVSVAEICFFLHFCALSCSTPTCLYDITCCHSKQWKVTASTCSYIAQNTSERVLN